MDRSRKSAGRLFGAVIAVVLALGGWAAVASSHSSYVVNAEFSDASQLIVGNLVEVGGVPVGKVRAIGLTRNGLADVQLEISDASFRPLHRGTTAYVSLPGLAGSASRYVSLDLGSGTAPEIRSGGVIPPTDTRDAVDLDVLLDSFTPAVRRSLVTLIAHGSALLNPSTSAQLNGALRYLNPALSQTAAVGRALLTDRAALTRLVSSSAEVSGALASHDADITGAIHNTAATLDQVAAQTGALGDALSRAPAVLAQLHGVLDDTDGALATLDPTLKRLQPVAEPTARLLRALAPVSAEAIPAAKQFGALLPRAEAALSTVAEKATGLPAALASLSSTINSLLPIVTGLRPYTPDVVAGLFQGLTGAYGGSYDANGHYARVQFVLGQTAGLGSLVPSLSNTYLGGTRTGLTARCPGGATPSAPDGSNPWIPPDDKGVCNPADDYAK